MEDISGKFRSAVWLNRSRFEKTEFSKVQNKIPDKILYAYNVYQIEGEGRKLFSSIEGDKNTIMGLPIKKIKELIKRVECIKLEQGL